MSLIQLAQAYQVMGERGVFHRLTLVKGGFPNQKIQAVRPEVANAVFQAMTSNLVGANRDGLVSRSALTRKLYEGKYSEKFVAHVYAGLVVSTKRKVVLAVYVDEPTTTNKDSKNFAEKAADAFFREEKVGSLSSQW